MDIALENMLEELDTIEERADDRYWNILGVNQDNPSFNIEMESVPQSGGDGGGEGDRYIIKVSCDGYKDLPARFDFVDPETGELNTPRAFPQSLPGDSFFNDDLVICHQANRTGYNEYGGPHGDWKKTAWENNDDGITSLVDMLEEIHWRLRYEKYQGPREPRT